MLQLHNKKDFIFINISNVELAVASRKSKDKRAVKFIEWIPEFTQEMYLRKFIGDECSKD
jgi:hypothetical protein